MKIRIINIIMIIGTVAIVFASCTKKLDRKPYVDVTSETVFNDPIKIKEALAKLYAGLSLSGQDVVNNPDIAALDVGANVYLRNYFEAQELPTDEAVISWNDADLQQYHTMNWTPNMSFIGTMYSRIFLEISLCNEFIRETPDSKLNSSGFSSSDIAAIQTYRNEARFLRAFSYWHAIDMFGNVPFVTESAPVGSFFPPQASRDSVFSFVESELLDLQNLLPDPETNEFGRADKGAAWMLLAKIYLNAEVYTGTARYTDAITYCNKIISSGAYSLEPNYANLFLADNSNSKEIIFAIRADGLTSQSYGNTTFIVHAQVGGSMDATNTFGIKSGGWAGLRTTKSLVQLFPDPSGNMDKRAMFYTNGQTLDIKDIKSFTDGYAISKYKNISSAGVPGSDPTGTFVDTDFPMFRLADVYLMYTEAVLRGGLGGDNGTALNYINLLRQRAYGNTSGNIAAADLTLDFIINERARELYWEGHRRTDLIRFGEFTGGTYLWPWKGGVEAGAAVDVHYNLYPIPSSDIVANPQLVQNPGY